MTKNRPVFVVMFAAYPVLFIAVSNPGQAAPDAVLTALAMAVVLSLLLLAALKFVLGSWNRASLAVGALTLAFFAYGPVHSAFEGMFLDSLAQPTGPAVYLQAIAPYVHPIQTGVWLVGFVLVWRTLKKTADDWVELIVSGCNAVGVVILALIAVQAFRSTDFSLTETAVSGSTGSGSVGASGDHPDVYVIVLDGYARADVLRQRYGFDNSPFLDGLAQRGFHIGDASTANYNWTFLSLASSLNMDYVQPLLGERISPAVETHAPVYEAVRNNAVARFLKARGYRVVHFQSTWGATLRNPYADEEVPCRQGMFANEFYRALAEASWLKVLHSRISTNLAECYRTAFDQLASTGRQAGPKFVFAHFILPHHPYLFDRDGRVLVDATLSNQFDFQKMLWEQKAKYVDQLVYVNEQVTRVVERIQAESAQPPVIVIYSDHGPNLANGMSQQEKISVRLANFAAYLLPNAPAGLVPPDGSLVNQFRYILNHYFDGQMDILPNRYYFSEFTKPYEFQEVAFSTLHAIERRPSNGVTH